MTAQACDCGLGVTKESTSECGGGNPASPRGPQVTGGTDFTEKQGACQRRDRWSQSPVIYFYNELHAAISEHGEITTSYGIPPIIMEGMGIFSQGEDMC